LAVHVLRSSTDLFRDSCSLGLGISGKAAKSFLYLPADIFGGSADTILVHGSSFAREGRGQWDRGTVASDGGSGVLILRGVSGRLLRKSGQPNKVPLAAKDFHGLG
jgi:hypothetical protein